MFLISKSNLNINLLIVLYLYAVNLLLLKQLMLLYYQLVDNIRKLTSVQVVDYLTKKIKENISLISNVHIFLFNISTCL